MTEYRAATRRPSRAECAPRRKCCLRTSRIEATTIGNIDKMWQQKTHTRTHAHNGGIEFRMCGVTEVCTIRTIL